MREIEGDLWTVPAKFRCITTNGNVRKNGCAVMGKGVALEAVQRAKRGHPPVDISKILGVLLQTRGNHVHLLSPTCFVSFPTKHDWRSASDLALIKQSATELAEMTQRLLGPADFVVLPRPGCQNGGLEWAEVRAVLVPILASDNYVVVTQPTSTP